MIYEELKKTVDSVNDMKEATGASTFTEVKDKVERMPVWDTFKSPLAQLGYTSEDEEFYSYLELGNLEELNKDITYSLAKQKEVAGARYMYNIFKEDQNIKYIPYLDASNPINSNNILIALRNAVSCPNFVNNKPDQCSFASCEKIKRLRLTNWDTSKTTRLVMMFAYCKSLEYLDISNWNTSSATDMTQMFQGCVFESIDVNHFDTSKVTTMGNTFNGCSNLTSLDVSNWDISNVTNMNNFCHLCTSLESLKINNFGVNKDVSIVSLIQTCLALGSTEEGMESLRYTFITNSFDRTAAGYPALNLAMPDVVKARFTDEEKAAITAKGFTIA